MTVKTSKDKTFDVNWMWGPVGDDDELMLELVDDRLLSEIAADFEGVEKFERFSEAEGDLVYEGYTELKSIFRSYTRTGSTVSISLVKP